MKGYYDSYGYRGFINGRYMLFASESEYAEYYDSIFSSKGDEQQQ